eukprot:CAMPEP_0119549100 /NCGR_PEP_ID=MMETSP1352-20130426/2884_1 /TAXON_ID=265584 /ORGANISM="Stauroneis constricta, Strain CCMP1120" /LENGTH=363 /DNA_ID=CAMNT_0007594565 /DNA_START=30 /DNA_END=1121 /DNA_ORIENTATION=-
MTANDSLALEGQDRLNRSDDDHERGGEIEGILIEDLKDSERRNRQHKKKLGGALCLALVVVIVLLSVLLTRDDKSGPSRSAPENVNADELKDSAIATLAPTLSPTASPTTPAPTVAPTAAPTTALQGSLAYKVIAPKLEDPSTLLDPTSPQHEALVLVADEGRQDEFSLVQRFAMMALFASTGGEDWGWSHGWKTFNDDECIWYGVRTCRYQQDLADHAATSLALSDNGLTGGIPSELCLLNKLESISLDSNELSGAVPSCVASLKFLDVVHLQENALSGSLDNLFTYDGIVTTPTYVELRLDNNNFSGTIPEAMEFLSDLRVLTLHGNPELTGSLNSFCNRGMDILTADCDTVECDCCTTCY